jgi:hypothetical protein
MRVFPPSRLTSTRGNPIPSFLRSISAPIATPTDDPTIAAARAILTHSTGRRDQIIIMVSSLPTKRGSQVPSYGCR